MFKFINFKLLRFFALSVFLGAQAFAQFEVSPDHFNSSAQQQAKHRRTKATIQSHAATAANSTKSAVVPHKKNLHKSKAIASAPQPVTREAAAR